MSFFNCLLGTCSALIWFMINRLQMRRLHQGGKDISDTSGSFFLFFFFFLISDVMLKYVFHLEVELSLFQSHLTFMFTYFSVVFLLVVLFLFLRYIYFIEWNISLKLDLGWIVSRLLYCAEPDPTRQLTLHAPRHHRAEVPPLYDWS